MAAALIQAPHRFDSERARRRRDRHVRLATERAVAEVALKLRVRDRFHRDVDRTQPLPVDK